MKLRITLVVATIALVLLAFFAWRASRQALPNAPLETVRTTETSAIANAPAEIASTDKPVATERTVAEAPVVTTPVVPSTSAKLQVLVVAKEDRRPLTNVHVLLRPRPRIESLSWIEVEGSHGTMSALAKCGPDGRVEFEAETGVALYVSANSDDGSAAYRELDVAPLVAGETRGVVLELVTTNDVMFFGRVIDRETRAPLAAEVRIESSRGQHELTTLHTDADGRFKCPTASWAPSTLVVLADGYAEVDVIAEKVHDSIEHALVIEATRAATLRVRLTDANDAAIAGALVSVKTDRYRLLFPKDAAQFAVEAGPWMLRLPTDGSGFVEMTGLPPEAPLMAVATRGKAVLHRELEPITLKVGETREVAWRVGGGCELKGRVIDQHDKPVVQRTLWLMRPSAKRPGYFFENGGDRARTAKTDDDGKFSFKDVEPGAWWVGPANDQRKLGMSKSDAAVPLEELVAPIAQLVEIAEEEAVHDVELRVDRGLYIRGQVLDPNGEPVAEAGVLGWQSALRLSTWSTVQGGDEFVLGPLTRGTYSISASGESFCDSDPVECTTDTSGVVLRLKLGGSISGTVIDGDTKQPFPAAVTYSRSSVGGGYGLTHSSSEGAFTFTGLESDLYAISANDSRGRVAIAHGIEVTAGKETKGVRLLLEAGAIARVRYDGDEPSGLLTISADGAAVAVIGLEKGSTRDFNVPRGVVKLSMTFGDAGTKFEQTFDFKVGETKVLEFTKDWK